MNSFIKSKKVRSLPFYEYLINPDWQELGHARVLMSRKKSGGRVVFGLFLVDLYCLGVKDVMAEEDMPKSKYEQFMKPMMYFDEKPIRCDQNLGHTVIYGGINYARHLGFEPHEDFELAKHLLIPEAEVAIDPSVKFGKDGRPFYIEGPQDDAEYVLATLKKAVGDGNFDFLSQEDMGINDDDQAFS